jgi:SAM-dependent methyltransferase
LLYFADKITIPLLREEGKRSVLEIGSSFGNSIRPILELGDVIVSIIDPCIDADLFREFGDRITLHKGLSLDVLPHLEAAYDCIFIDGDHNWYTVFNELRLIEERRLLNTDGLIFLHDIGWPYGRRDMYYQPETIPADFRNPYAKQGMSKGRSRLVDSGGFNAGHYNALDEFGEKNGVLTAVEDYLRQSKEDFYFIKDPREYGFGVLMKKSPRNGWRTANKLRLRIFRQIWLEPYYRPLLNRASLLRSSRPANLVRRLRNALR